MSCIWNGNLHRWRDDRSNRYSQKKFLHQDHGYHQNDSHIWSVVRCRFGPVARSLSSLIDLLWGTVAYSHTTMCPTDNHLNITSLLPLKKHTYGTHQEINGYAPLISDWIRQLSFGHIHTVTFKQLKTSEDHVHSIIPWLNSSCKHQENSSLWILQIIGHLLGNIQYGMQQLQHYNFGWQT